MKKLFLLVSAVLFIGCASAEDRPYQYSKLPQEAKSFITTHFAGVQVSSTIVDDDFINPDYTVYLANNSKVEFSNSGTWKEVSSMSGVPATVIPAKIMEYIKANYAAEKVLKIDKDRNDYELKLSNRVELKFSLAGDFISMDYDD